MFLETDYGESIVVLDKKHGVELIDHDRDNPLRRRSGAGSTDRTGEQLDDVAGARAMASKAAPIGRGVAVAGWWSEGGRASRWSPRSSSGVSERRPPRLGPPRVHEQLP